MNCPKCRREIAYDAMEHKVCGWKLASRAHADSIVPSSPIPGPRVVKKNPPMKPETRALLDKLLAKMKAHQPAPLKREPSTDPGYEVVPGHGTRCVCESCFPARVDPKRRAHRAELAAKFPLPDEARPD